MGFMLSYLCGQITEKNLETKTFVLEVNNIGYLIHSNLKELQELENQNSSENKIYTLLLTREDSQKLYGFGTKASRDLFEILLSVSGVGPKGALSLLELLDIDRLVSAVLRDEAELLAKAQGIGLKTSKRIILELNNKLKRGFYTGNSEKVQESSGKLLFCQQEASAILENLGFSLIDIDRKLAKAREAGIEDETESLVRYCLA